MPHRHGRLGPALFAVVLTACSGGDDAAPGDTATVPDTTVDALVDTAADTTGGTDDTTSTRPTSTSPTSSSTTSSTTSSTVPVDPYTVATATRTLVGAPSAIDGVRAFLAVPYAEAPVGDLAWRAPVARASSDEPFDATGEGASCPQPTDGLTTSFLVTPPSDPDCLTLSVWSPDGAADLPVMVWFHGGGLSTGSAHEPYYTGDDLAADGVVVVNVNYRLGPFGFLAPPGSPDDGGAVANAGFLDQQLALEWVRDEIAGFGGDPSNVTLFGESAGGFSVCGHLASPGSVGLFARAIVQSGGGCDRLTPLETAAERSRALLDAVGCEDVVCLRDAPVEEVLAAGRELSSLVLDGAALPGPAVDLAAGTTAVADGVEVMIGSNLDEAALFTLGRAEPTEDELSALAGTFVAADDVGALVALYDEQPDRLQAYRDLLTDATFACPALSFAGRVPGTFVYEYVYVPDGDPLGVGATHGAELAALFAHPEGLLIETQPNERSDLLSDAMQAAWVGFATSGDPGSDFEPYDATGSITVLDVPFSTTTVNRGGRCAAVNELRAR